MLVVTPQNNNIFGTFCPSKIAQNSLYEPLSQLSRAILPGPPGIEVVIIVCGYADVFLLLARNHQLLNSGPPELID